MNEDALEFMRAQRVAFPAVDADGRVIEEGVRQAISYVPADSTSPARALLASSAPTCGVAPTALRTYWVALVRNRVYKKAYTVYIAVLSFRGETHAQTDLLAAARPGKRQAHDG